MRKVLCVGLMTVVFVAGCAGPEPAPPAVAESHQSRVWQERPVVTESTAEREQAKRQWIEQEQARRREWVADTVERNGGTHPSSIPEVPPTPEIGPAPRDRFEETLRAMLAEGLIHSVDVANNRVRIPVANWLALPLETKQGLVVGFSAYFDSCGSTGRVRILSDRNDICLAEYGAWGGIKIHY